jgi:hypothetical protein
VESTHRLQETIYSHTGFKFMVKETMAFLKLIHIELTGVIAEGSV